MDRFCVVLADPPWRFNDRLTMSNVKRGAESNYPTLDTKAIAALPVREWVAEDALLALWCPASLLADGLPVLMAWGFTFKTIWTWAKTSRDGAGLAFGMGHYFRAATEHALIATRGHVLPASRSERNLYLAPSLSHSVKPTALAEALERMFPGGPFLELFARRMRDGWKCIGNEIDGRDVRAIRTVEDL